MRYTAEREAVAEGCRRLAADGLVVGTSGNVSVRCGEHVAISPTGVDYDRLDAAGVTVIDLDGNAVEGDLLPSSEWRMHTHCYRARTEAAAVVHAHPVAATAVSTLVDEVPPIHYLLAQLGGPVRVASYATYGTHELAEASVAGLDGRTGVLLANHGATTLGTTLAQAHTRMRTLEWVCRVWLAARTAGDPALLEASELDRVGEKLRSYGQPTATGEAER